MSKIVTVPVNSLQAAMREVISAHAAVRQGIATHAEKHEAELDARRHEAELNARIAEGVTKHNAGL